jgi:hypothetical protein
MGTPRQPNLAIFAKMQKLDLQDSAATQGTLMLIRECLPQVDPYAAALAAGHDFVLIEDGKSEDDEQRTFTDMMKLKLFAEIKNSTFRETHKENEMPIIHLEEEDSCDGQLLLDADKTLRAVIALTSNPETMRTLTSFHTGVEKIEHVLVTIGLVTISDTPRLFKFLSIDNFAEFESWRAWSAYVHQKWQEIDFDKIAFADIEKYVLCNASRKYQVIIDKIMVDHPDCTYEEFNQFIARWEEQRSMHSRRPHNTHGTHNHRNRQRALAAHPAQESRSDGSNFSCALCKGEHKTHKCPKKNHPEYQQARRDYYAKRAEKQGRRNAGQKPANDPRSQSRPKNELETIRKELAELKQAVRKQTANAASVATESWAGIASKPPKKGHAAFVTTIERDPRRKLTERAWWIKQIDHQHGPSVLAKHKMKLHATYIQKIWRGYWVRQARKPPGHRLPGVQHLITPIPKFAQRDRARKALRSLRKQVARILKGSQQCKAFRNAMKHFGVPPRTLAITLDRAYRSGARHQRRYSGPSKRGNDPGNGYSHERCFKNNDRHTYSESGSDSDFPTEALDRRLSTTHKHVRIKINNRLEPYKLPYSNETQEQYRILHRRSKCSAEIRQVYEQRHRYPETCPKHWPTHSGAHPLLKRSTP